MLTNRTRRAGWRPRQVGAERRRPGRDEICRHAGQHVRRLSREAMPRREMIDQLEQSTSRSDIDVHPLRGSTVGERDPGRHEARWRRAGRNLVARKPETGDRGLVHGEPDAHRSCDFDRRTTDLAVTLGEMQVSGQEQCSRDVHWQKEPAPDNEVPNVEVATILTRWNRPQPGRCEGRTAPEAPVSATGKPRSSRIRSRSCCCA